MAHPIAPINTIEKTQSPEKEIASSINDHQEITLEQEALHPILKAYLGELLQHHPSFIADLTIDRDYQPKDILGILPELRHRQSDASFFVKKIEDVIEATPQTSADNTLHLRIAAAPTLDFESIPKLDEPAVIATFDTSADMVCQYNVPILDEKPPFEDMPLTSGLIVLCHPASDHVSLDGHEVGAAEDLAMKKGHLDKKALIKVKDRARQVIAIGKSKDPKFVDQQVIDKKKKQKENAVAVSRAIEDAIAAKVVENIGEQQERGRLIVDDIKAQLQRDVEIALAQGKPLSSEHIHSSISDGISKLCAITELAQREVSAVGRATETHMIAARFPTADKNRNTAPQLLAKKISSHFTSSGGAPPKVASSLGAEATGMGVLANTASEIEGQISAVERRGAQPALQNAAETALTANPPASVEEVAEQATLTEFELLMPAQPEPPANRLTIATEGNSQFLVSDDGDATVERQALAPMNGSHSPQNIPLDIPLKRHASPQEIQEAGLVTVAAHTDQWQAGKKRAQEELEEAKSQTSGSAATQSGEDLANQSVQNPSELEKLTPEI